MGKKSAGGGSGSKGNRRRSNVNRSLKQDRGHANAKKVKDHNRATQEAAKLNNEALRELGMLTPWETAEAHRAAERAADPAVQARARKVRAEVGQLS